MNVISKTASGISVVVCAIPETEDKELAEDIKDQLQRIQDGINDGTRELSTYELWMAKTYDIQPSHSVNWKYVISSVPLCK